MQSIHDHPSEYRFKHRTSVKPNRTLKTYLCAPDNTTLLAISLKTLARYSWCMQWISHIGCSVMVLGKFAESDESQPRSRCCAAAGHCHAWIAGAEESYGLITESTTKWVSVQPGITRHDIPYHLLAQLPTGGLVGFCHVWNVGGCTEMSEQA